MNVYIDNVSALYFLSMIETSLDDVSALTRLTSPSDAATSRAALRDIDLKRFDFGRGPLHLLTDRPAKRSEVSGVRFHVRTKELPIGSFRRLDKGVYIASPELCFYEMANRLSFPKLVEFGFLLCGTYTVNPSAEKKNGREPLTTKRKLESFACRMGDARGRATVLKALGYVLEGSASPRETKTTLLLTFPVRLGGYGFEKPLMNYRIDFTATERKLFGREYVVLDLYWSSCDVGVEYDGGEEHAQTEQLSSDRRKNSELNYRGISVVRVDKQQLASPHQVYVLACKLQRLMGIRHRNPTPEQKRRKRELYETLM